MLEYFDAFLIGLTATPSKQTIGFFDRNLVMEYSPERAVADSVNVGYDVYRIKTAITEAGGKVEAGYYVDKRDKLTRRLRVDMISTGTDIKPLECLIFMRDIKSSVYFEQMKGRGTPRAFDSANSADPLANPLVRIR